MTDTEPLYAALQDADKEIEAIKVAGADLFENLLFQVFVFAETYHLDPDVMVDRLEDIVAELMADAAADATERKRVADEAIGNIEHRDQQLSKPVVL